ncbi:hypothetical protein [Microlunatus sp. Gsoil 973]|uniref:hypothetical protein n=1 Tax=Microlunatus sp. Gsoil 973 TaxID=2672569 RepID=UPI0012B47DB8|nr:hypothetical protein [Microlunatus sp. Gsoil 973]QGN33209.1 hypothetical protein GJV80_10780 [Microlunatus sp. Gsoil 973]
MSITSRNDEDRGFMIMRTEQTGRRLLLTDPRSWPAMNVMPPPYTDFQCRHDAEVDDHPYPHSPKALSVPCRVPGQKNRRRRTRPPRLAYQAEELGRRPNSPYL